MLQAARHPCLLEITQVDNSNLSSITSLSCTYIYTRPFLSRIISHPVKPPPHPVLLSLVDPSTILPHAIHTPLSPYRVRPRAGRVQLHASSRPRPVLVHQPRRGSVAWKTTKDSQGLRVLSKTVSTPSRLFFASPLASLLTTSEKSSAAAVLSAPIATRPASHAYT